MARDRSLAHFVYLYRDDRGRPRYAGYGERAARATSHLSGSHNEALNRFLSKGKYTLEIAGPFASEETARAVETALISALEPFCNMNAGETRWRFRHLGIPERFSHRLLEPMLTRSDFIRAQSVPHSPVLFVRVGDQTFEDGRVGYDPANPPSDKQIVERINRWWQLGPYVRRWIARPAVSPGILVGVSGSPGAQIVIGAVEIDKNGWSSAVQNGGLFQVPITGPLDLDASGLRGRRIDLKARIRFGSIKPQFFIILQVDGTVVGGHPSLHRTGIQKRA